MPRQQVWWTHEGREYAIPLVPGKIYMTPTGFKIRIEKHQGAPSWRIIGTSGEGTFCHKPCTVSGGGKSEISKPISDAILQGPVFVADFKADFDRVASLLELCDDQTRANRVNRSCRHENDVVCRHRVPYDQIRNRTIVDGLTQ